MTKAEVIALQESLNRQGANLIVDGRYGPATRAAYAEYLDRDTAVPTVVPPAPKPWYLSRAVVGILVTLVASVFRHFDIIVDAKGLTDVILQFIETSGLVLAFVGTVRRDRPIDRGLVAPGVRLDTKSRAVPAERETDIRHLRGPFGY
jgi:hypothetical protein